jgi:hypothetical protein
VLRAPAAVALLESAKPGQRALIMSIVTAVYAAKQALRDGSRIAEADRLVLVQGIAGTGKSTVVKSGVCGVQRGSLARARGCNQSTPKTPHHMRLAVQVAVTAILAIDKMKPVTAAFCAAAAIIINGKTLHSVFNVPVRKKRGGGSGDIRADPRHPQFERLARLLRDCPLLIVDEVCACGWRGWWQVAAVGVSPTQRGNRCNFASISFACLRRSLWWGHRCGHTSQQVCALHSVRTTTKLSYFAPGIWGR